MKTTIQIDIEVHEALQKLGYKGQTFNSILRKILKIDKK